MATWRSSLLGLALCVLGTLAWAQVPGAPARVVIVSSDTAAVYAQAAQALADGLVRQGVSRSDISQSFASELVIRLKSGQPPHPAIFVTLGSAATQALVEGNAQAPVLSALIPRHSFESILRSNGRTMSGRLSVIYLDQPLARQLALIRLALPQARRLGVLCGPESLDRATELKTLVSAYGLELHQAVVTQPEDFSTALPRLLNDIDVLLALADPKVFNSSTIQNILLASFHERVPLVAFSPAYVRAGAVLAVYSTPFQAGNQAADVVLGVLRGQVLPDHAIEPSDFEVGVNVNVARALGLSPDAAQLRMALRRQEHQP
ncbi:ABC transporter substrate binding protein [Rhodoferax sp.]|uniref:ABC transporter substrate-binding protein n=1 Tax=Rhodoferax sp. TaxID=50421 RepID=UPI00284A3437|nr:ABC transporter substrate binding protein [Rhodoferax sp.]MDR3369619.1 ABC transporter substrate binding protein [Rhodoferax sp.]